MIAVSNGRDADKHREMTSFMEAGFHAAKLLGSPAAVGMTLVEGYFAGRPWVTPKDAAARAGVSHNTAHRRLEELLAIGRVESRDLGSARKAYRIMPRIAERVMARVPGQAPAAQPLPAYG